MAAAHTAQHCYSTWQTQHGWLHDMAGTPNAMENENVMALPSRVPFSHPSQRLKHHLKDCLNKHAPCCISRQQAIPHWYLFGEADDQKPAGTLLPASVWSMEKVSEPRPSWMWGSMAQACR